MTASGLPYAEAVAAVLAQAAALPVERVPLEAADGRALAEPVHSPVSLPPWDNAGMDGYAVRAADVRGASRDAPVRLAVRGTIAAGADASALAATAGQCVRIMTGAPVPAGADAVVRIEDTDRGEATVAIFDDRDVQSRGRNIRPRGEDVAAGACVFEAGTSIGPAQLGVLASIGAATVAVHRRPRVTVLSSGDELVLLDRFDEVLAGRRIVSSSSYMLPSLLQRAGADVTRLPLTRDDEGAMREAIGGALDAGCDLLVTTGGVSVGAHDYTRSALEAVGATLRFWRARIRPGGPIGTGVVRGVPWLGLPGNPVSTMVTARLFALPLVRRLAGHAAVQPVTLRVRAVETAPTPAPLTHFLRVTLAPGHDGVPEAQLAGGQSSGQLRTLAVAKALLIVPEADEAMRAGELYDALPLGEEALWRASTP